MLGSPAGPGGPSQRGLWPLAPAPPNSTTGFPTDGLGKYGVYSLFSGGPAFGSALYSHASTIGRFASGHIQQTGTNTFHAAHKVADSLFSATGYAFGAPTTPPGSPYSPVPLAQVELYAKGFSNNIIIQDFPTSPKKIQITEKRCDEKCCMGQKAQRTCHGLTSPVKKIHEVTTTGCSRTNPIEWTGVNVKKEPGTLCQLTEITARASPVVKVEVTSPTQKSIGDHIVNGSSPLNVNGAQIPVGIAVARQRVQHEVVASPSLPPAGLLTTVNVGGGAQIKEIDNAGSVASMAAGTSGAVAGGGTMLQCGDDRTSGLAAWQLGGNHNQTMTTPTLWQYPAPIPVESMVPLPVPTMPPVGFQLIRDPTSGGIFLLPTTTGIEPLQQTVVWPSYPQPSPVLLPSLSSMPPPPLQLLSSASSDYLSSSTTLHQHTQTHSTRLVAVTTDAKRKIPLPLPATTLIKIETDGTLDQTKTLQAVSTIANSTGTVFTDQSVPPLVTTHVIYQHPTTNLIVSQTPVLSADNTSCRSQATSPVTAGLTPPPETMQIHEEEHVTVVSTVQDASNQTDIPICSEDDNTAHTISDVIGVEKIKEIVKNDVQESNIIHQPQIDSEHKVLEQSEPKIEEVEDNCEDQQPDISGLELLSNSIEEFERAKQPIEETSLSETSLENSSVISSEESIENKETNHQVAMNVDDTLGGLDLLCALAEQRIMEENIEKPEKKSRRDKHKDKEHKKRKKKHSSDEPRKKKLKSDKHRSEDRHKDREHRKKEKKHSFDYEKEKSSNECSCQYKHYKTPESEQEVKRFLESKARQGYCCQGDWPCMNAMELDMRTKLAELQKEYREKQKELSKLKPKKHEGSKKKFRKKSNHSESSIPPLPNHVSQNESLVVQNSQSTESLKRRHSQSDSSPEKHFSSSKKRKVGRPKRLMSTGEVVATETIVAKKLKNNFVGCLLAAKEKLKQQSNNDSHESTPPRYVEEPYTHKLKRIKNNNNILMSEIKSSKIRPKLKAEATVKTEVEDDEINDWQEELYEDHSVPFTEAIKEDNNFLYEEEKENTVSTTEIVEKESPPVPSNPCTLTDAHLETDKLRVLTAMGGLFYAGQLNAIEPPDVYSITLDGERGNRPHIMSREEILRDAIVEVAPKSTEELPVGTRLCAYWSQQYRCLYPGSAAEPGTPDPQLDEKFVSVEFDDGDSGRIALQDIRLLPPNYPIIEYDPNPLLSLSKRRRRISTSVSTDEKQQSEVFMKVTFPEPLSTITEQAATEFERYKEKKRLKKKKKEKSEDKKKKKKHKCTDEYCKHKKHHKKHKRHRKHHDKSDRSRTDSPKGEFICQIISGNDDFVIEKLEAEEKENLNLESNKKILEDEFSHQSSVDDFPNYEAPANPDDEVTMDDILEDKKAKKLRDRQESCESRSKMSAFLPARQLWHWSGKGYKRPRAKGKSKKCFYKSIERGKESITVGDAAVFLSTGKPDRPYIGTIQNMWELCGKMIVRVKWFYHPEETIGCPKNLQYPGALFESPHCDENDVQTISHKCEVLPLKEYTARLGDDPARYATIYENNDIYYLAGSYIPGSETLKMEPGIPFTGPE
ncbi:hypothetical protein ABEB36_008371 [Hypothenemus hampei]|uniref:BAH domain-containing protein n=1 Tax=Hypothenemus hampei TaxID=57062 RepID=A0ABD1ELK8_HYPHA